MSEDNRPVCKRCGLPARHVTGRATVLICLNPDGSPGKVERVSHTIAMESPTYVDGQGHRFDANGDRK